MESPQSETWINSTADAEVTNAVQMLNEMASIETTLVEFESTAESETNILLKIDQLADLNRWYIDKFGIPFEVRRFFQNELVSLIQQKTRSQIEATEVATEKYERVHGPGMPRLIRLIVGATRNQMINETLLSPNRRHPHRRV